MGNMCASDTVVTVEIIQEGCCGNLGFTCQSGGDVFPRQMDERLKPHVTEKEYEAVIDKCSAALRAEGKRTRWVSLTMIPIAIIGSIAGSTVIGQYKPEYFDCTASQGVCGLNEAPSTGACCTFWCCDKDLTGPFQFEAMCDLTKRVETDDGRVLQTCNCVTTGSGKGKRRVCDKVHVEGESELVPAENIWAAVVGVMFIVVGSLCWLVWLGFITYSACSLPCTLVPHFAAWESRGLKCRYQYRKPRIYVAIPAAPGAATSGAKWC